MLQNAPSILNVSFFGLAFLLALMTYGAITSPNISESRLPHIKLFALISVIMLVISCTFFFLNKRYNPEIDPEEFKKAKADLILLRDKLSESEKTVSYLQNQSDIASNNLAQKQETLESTQKTLLSVKKLSEDNTAQNEAEISRLNVTISELSGSVTVKREKCSALKEALIVKRDKFSSEYDYLHIKSDKQIPFEQKGFDQNDIGREINNLADASRSFENFSQHECFVR